MNQPILTSRNALGRFFFLPALFLILIQNGTAPALQGVTGDSLPDYIWPTNASRTLSSSFAETREGHFHFGIDIRTNSSVGYPCYAVEDGDVVRVRVSPYGYGRALYLKLKDGRTAVYAHLQRFAPPVEKIVRKKQYQHRSFRCQIYFKPGEIPFKKGDVVAYSGSSGIGHPHLHFEIRDDKGYLNPNLFGFVVEDSRPPVAEEIALIPLDVESEIEANFEPKIYSLKSSERGFTGFYKLEEIPEVYGKFGMGISGYDLADGADNKMSFYGLDFYIDDSLCFSARYDSIGFEKTKQVELERNFRLQRRGIGVFHQLWRNPHTTVDFYRAGEGILDTRNFPAGRHDFEVVLLDYMGNTTYVSGQLNFQQESVYPTVPSFSRWAGFWGSRTNPAAAKAHGLQTDTHLKADFFDDFIAFSVVDHPSITDIQLFMLQPFELRIPLIHHGPEWIGKLPLEPFSSGTWTFEIQLEDDRGSIRVDTAAWVIQPIPISGGVVFSEDSLFRAHFRRGTVYSTLYTRVTPKKPPAKEIFKSQIYTLNPFDVPLKGEVEVSISIPKDETQPDKLGIYALSKKGKWTFVDNDRRLVSNAVSGVTPTLEKYALIKDVDPPELRWLSPRLTTSDRRPTFRLKIVDELSGVDDRTISLEIDGKWVLMEYDPEKDRIFGQPEDSISPGQHRVEVTVKDFCGNERRIQRTINVVNP